MIDLHTHSLFSDGELIPAELVRRAAVKGYKALAITDHADQSNIDFILPRIVRVCRMLAQEHRIPVIPGIELTHVPPRYIAELALEARRFGAMIVVVHGETPVEPVMPGTNEAALKADIDILAHPGLISEPCMELAKKSKAFLEISARRGHSLTNGHVVMMARKFKVPLVLNTDSHAPGDLIDDDMAAAVIRGAGMDENETKTVLDNARMLVDRVWDPER